MTSKECENAISVAVVAENTTVIPGLDPGIQGSTGLCTRDFASLLDAHSTRLSEAVRQPLHPTPGPSPSRGGEVLAFELWLKTNPRSQNPLHTVAHPAAHNQGPGSSWERGSGGERAGYAMPLQWSWGPLPVARKRAIQLQ